MTFKLTPLVTAPSAVVSGRIKDDRDDMRPEEEESEEVGEEGDFGRNIRVLTCRCW